MKYLYNICFAFLLVIILAPDSNAQYSASKDNTMYEGTLYSNGAGDHFFAGRTWIELQGVKRRGLLAFDLSSIPVEARIRSVKLTLHMSRTKRTTGRTVTIHRLLQNWGEESSHASGNEGGGASAAVGDATWNFAYMRSVSWKIPGGDFSATASASQTVGDIGYYTWSSSNMVSDVQNWVSTPGLNYGWLVKGDESDTTTTKRFDSRTNPTVVNRPVLVVEYEAPDVYISEVFQYSEKKGFPGEFIEIYNTGKIEQNLDGWWLFQPNLELVTSLGEKSLLNGDLILKPGEYAVIGRGSADEFKKLWGFLPDTYFSEGNSSNAGAPQINDGAYWRLYNPFQAVVDRYGSSDTFQFSSGRNHYTRINYPNNGMDIKHWLADTKWGNPGTDNLAPVAVNDNSDVIEDGSVIINILSNDHDLDGSLNGSSVEIMSNPAHGNITNVNSKTGAVTYEPDKDYHGSDQFKYMVFDDKGKPSNQATVFIIVHSVNDAPVVVADTADTNEDTAVEIDVLFNDEDIDGALVPASVIISKSPAHGNTGINTTTGVITYTPDTDYNGPDLFSYTVEDDSGAVSNTAVVTLTIGAQNDPPVISKLPVLEFNEDETLELPLTELYKYVDDPETPDEQLDLKLSNGNNVETSLEGSIVIIASRLNWFGKDTISLEVSDGELSDTADLYVVVNSINDIPEISGLPKTLALNADSTVDLMLWPYVSDVETPDNVLKYSFNTSDDSLKYSFDAASGKLTLSAISGLNHDVTLEISVRDDSAATAKDEIIVQVETISALVDLNSSQLPLQFKLSQNYPNPFNPSTTIRYQLPEALDVHLAVYNSLGQSVAVLVSERQPAGEYRIKFDTISYGLSSGIYIYHLRAGKFRQTRKMVLMR